MSSRSSSSSSPPLLAVALEVDLERVPLRVLPAPVERLRVVELDLGRGSGRRRRARMIAEAACSWTRWVSLDLDVLEAGRGELALELVARSARRRCSRSTAPCRARVASSMSGSATTSLTAKRPPGRRTRAASRKTRGLSPERLITQLEMITSTESSGSGTSSIVPLRNSTFSTPASRWLRARELEHLVGHVEAVGLAGRPDAPGGEQHVDPAARAEVEDRLALVQVGDRGRVAAAERRELRRVGQRVALVVVVEPGAEGLALLVGDHGGVAAAAAAPSLAATAAAA